VRIGKKRYLLSDQKKYTREELIDIILKNLLVRRKRRAKGKVTRREKRLNLQDMKVFEQFEKLNRGRSRNLVLPTGLDKSSLQSNTEQSFFNALVKFSGNVPKDINVVNRAPPPTVLVHQAITPQVPAPKRVTPLLRDLPDRKSSEYNARYNQIKTRILDEFSKPGRKRDKTEALKKLIDAESIPVKHSNPTGGTKSTENLARDIIEYYETNNMGQQLVPVFNTYFPEGINLPTPAPPDKTGKFPPPPDKTGKFPPPPDKTGKFPPAPPGPPPPPDKTGKFPPAPPAPSKTTTVTKYKPPAAGGLGSLFAQIKNLGQSGLKKGSDRKEAAQVGEQPQSMLDQLKSVLGKRGNKGPSAAKTGETMDQRIERERREKIEQKQLEAAQSFLRGTKLKKIPSITTADEINKNPQDNIVTENPTELVDPDAPPPLEIEDVDQTAAGVVVRTLANQKRDQPLSTDEIDNMMRGVRGYIGTFPADFMKFLPKRLPKVFSFIMNTDPSSKPGKHWVAVRVDTRDENAVEYYDSFAEQASKRFMKQLKKLVDKLDVPVYLKLKINRIKEQNTSTNNCGWFAMSFIINRGLGQPFRECTGYDDSQNGEQNIDSLKNKFGYV